MNLAIAHLSDIHIRTPSDAILTRATQIATALLSVTTEPSVYLLAFSGDLAYGGSKHQYELFATFLDALTGALRARAPNLQIEIAFVPGNHDCDFSHNLETRDIVRGGIPSRLDSLKNHGDVVELMTLVQREFFDFAASRGAWSKDSGYMYWEREFQVGTQRVRLHCYNTAWMSQLHEEPGALLYPVPIADAAHSHQRPTSLAIAMLHHPLGWLAPVNSHSLRQHLDSTADLVITGHEHIGRSYTVEEDGGSRLTHIEGCVLQEHGDPKSEFQIFSFDLAESIFRRIVFEWNQGIYRRKTEKEPVSYQRNPSLPTKRFSHSTQFFAVLDDCGVEFAHPRADIITLSNIFVMPDFRARTFDDDMVKRAKRKGRIAGTAILSELHSSGVGLIAGPSGSGRTSLAKRLVRDLHSGRGLVPVLIDGQQFKAIGRDDTIKVVEREFMRQYSSAQLEHFRQLDKRDRVVVVDDFHRAKLNRRSRMKLLAQLSLYAGLVIGLVDDLYLLEHVSTGPDVRSAESVGIAIYEISEFGWRLRRDLIAKWHRLGHEVYSDEAAVERQIEESENLIATLMGKNLLPAYPITILTILQAHEASSPQSRVSGSFGHMYEHLITVAFAKLSSRSIDIDARYACASHIAFAMFRNGSQSLSRGNIAAAIDTYSRTMRINLSSQQEIDALADSRILEVRADSLHFRHKYFYCYFVARYLRDHRADPTMQSHLVHMADRIQLEDFANVLSFYVYLTKDLEIVDYVLGRSREMFREFAPSDLEVGFVSSLFKELRPMTLPAGGDAETHRGADRSRRDSLDDEMDEEEDDPHDESHVYRDDLDEVLKINFAFKSMQVLGQVLRNFPGSLPGDKKEEIATECYQLGLRTMSAFFGIAESGFDEFRRYFAKLIKEQRPMASADELALGADELVIWLTLGCAYGILKRVAAAVGLEELQITYADVLRRLESTISVRMIDIAIRLDHFSTPPVSLLMELAKDLHGKPFASALLRDMVGNYLYIYRTEDVRVRQQLGDLFQIQATKPKFIQNPDKRT